MSRIPPPKEPSGCIQTAVITRIILQILFVPLVMIMGAIVGILLALYAFSEHPLLGFAVVMVAGLVMFGLARWEYMRVGKEFKELPPED